MPLDKLTQEMIVVIDNLQKTKLYTASEAAATRYDPKRYPEQYRKLARKIWRVVNERKESSDLGSWPDNCACWENGFPKHDRGEKAKIILLPGEDSPRWQGNTLRMALNEKEHRFLSIHRLTIALSNLACKKIDEIQEETEDSTDLPGDAPEIDLEIVPEQNSSMPSDATVDANMVGFTFTIKLDNEEHVHYMQGFMTLVPGQGIFQKAYQETIQNQKKEKVEPQGTAPPVTTRKYWKRELFLPVLMGLLLFSLLLNRHDSVAERNQPKETNQINEVDESQQSGLKLLEDRVAQYKKHRGSDVDIRVICEKGKTTRFYSELSIASNTSISRPQNLTDTPP